MLNKAIAAKDFQIESSDNKVASLVRAHRPVHQALRPGAQHPRSRQPPPHRRAAEREGGALPHPGRPRDRPREPDQDPEEIRRPAQEDPPRHAGATIRALRRGGGRDECPAAEIAGRRVRRLPPKPRSLAGLFLLRMGARRGWFMKRSRCDRSSPLPQASGGLRWEHPSCGGEELEVGVEKLERCASSRQPEAKTAHSLSRVGEGQG